MATVTDKSVSSGEKRYKRLQSAGSYDLRKDTTSRRWGIYYPIVPRTAQAQIPNAIAAVQSLNNLPNWSRNVFSAQIPTGRTFVGERLKYAWVPYNVDTAAWLTSLPSIVQEQQMKNLLSAMYTKWGRQGAADGFDAEFAGWETLPVFSDFMNHISASGTTSEVALSSGTYGGDRGGEYRFTVPISFGQTVQVTHLVDWGLDPYTIAPGLFTSSGAGACNFTLMFCVEGGLTRLGV